jgi:hypothetical protein
MVMSLNLTAWGLGVSTAPQIGGLLWRAGGFPAITWFMLAMGLLALATAYIFLARPAVASPQPASRAA